MKNKFLILILLFACILSTFSQNIKVDGDCLQRNCAIFSKKMIDIFGEDAIANILDSNISFVLGIKVDLLGMAKKITITRYKGNMRLDMQSILDSLIPNNVKFDICYANDPPENPETKIKRLQKHIQKKGDTIQGVYFGFPTTIFTQTYYEYDNKKWIDKGGVSLSKIEYLKYQINKYVE